MSETAETARAASSSSRRRSRAAIRRHRRKLGQDAPLVPAFGLEPLIRLEASAIGIEVDERAIVVVATHDRASLS